MFRGHSRAQVVHYTPLIQQIIEQTRLRVLPGESVPAKEKLFSLFEEHTDIVIKGSRDSQLSFNSLAVWSITVSAPSILKVSMLIPILTVTLHGG